MVTIGAENTAAGAETPAVNGDTKGAEEAPAPAMVTAGAGVVTNAEWKPCIDFQIIDFQMEGIIRACESTVKPRLAGSETVLQA